MTIEQLRWLVISHVRLNKASYGLKETCKSLHECEGKFVHEKETYRYQTKMMNREAKTPAERMHTTLFYTRGGLPKTVQLQQAKKLVSEMKISAGDASPEELEQFLKQFRK